MKIVQLQNPLMKFHKTLKGKLSGEDLLIRPTVLDKYDSESLVQIKPYTSRLEIAASLDAALHRTKTGSGSGLQFITKQEPYGVICKQYCK